MTLVVVAEKPRVACDIARVLGVRKKGQGFLEGNGYRVTWALGHLVHFAESDDYGPPWSGRWSTAPLPMIPQQWQLKTARFTVQQFQMVKRLINDAGTEQIVCATDAGREGEHIFRLIYAHARCRKPVQQLWVSSLADEAIGESPDWEAPSGQQWTVAVGGGIGKIFKIASQAINAQVHYYSNVEKPDIVGDSSIRLQLQFMFPK